ncbi:hypothetical protein HELRODRAFT_179002 [Helobdella robusta]|uniref:Uncharacterized protein n=1 Tax=Helobdella robusta TaxID=6412 RepID=T1FE14_HELRO|nr:hypothetical protein HELRODRAFT_179002 [Helobdella robusta]ESN95818.1 hypothetical protein HELRODRAFT_179002 [Helobdella robusta]
MCGMVQSCKIEITHVAFSCCEHQTSSFPHSIHFEILLLNAQVYINKTSFALEPEKFDECFLLPLQKLECQFSLTSLSFPTTTGGMLKMLKLMLPTLLLMALLQASTSSTTLEDERFICGLQLVESSVYQPYSGNRAAMVNLKNTLLSIAYLANLTHWCRSTCDCSETDKKDLYTKEYPFPITCKTLMKIETHILCRCEDGYEQNRYNVCVPIEPIKLLDPLLDLTPLQTTTQAVLFPPLPASMMSPLVIGLIILGILLLLLLCLLILLLCLCCRKRKKKEEKKDPEKKVEMPDLPKNDYSYLPQVFKVTVEKESDDYDFLKTDFDLKVAGADDGGYAKIGTGKGEPDDKLKLEVGNSEKSGKKVEVAGNIYSEEPGVADGPKKKGTVVHIAVGEKEEEEATDYIYSEIKC